MEYYNFRGKSFSIKEEDKEKYIIVACARQENDYIIEWVEHYLNLGFDKIFIGDNNGIGDDSLELILKDYIDKNVIEIIDIRGEEKIQVEFYSMFSLKGNYKWCAYFDCDEFLELNAFDNIKTFLETNHKNDNIVEFNWVVYSNNGEIKKSKGNIQERFKHPLPLLYGGNFFRKTIVNGKYKCLYHVHTVNDDELLWEKPIGYKEGYLKHYKFKSLEEQISTFGRGDAAVGKNFMNNYYKLFTFDEEYFKILKVLEKDNWLHDEYQEIQKNTKVIIFTNEYRYIPNVFRRILILMLNNTNKIFYINSEKPFPEQWFNILFEYGLHTGNKITLQYPVLKNGFIYQNFILKEE